MKVTKRVDAFGRYLKAHPKKLTPAQHKLFKSFELVELWKSLSEPQKAADVGQALRGILLAVKAEQSKDEEETPNSVEDSAEEQPSEDEDNPEGENTPE